MYPDLEEDDKSQNLSGAGQTTYQSTTVTQTQKGKEKKKAAPTDDNCCILGAKIWVSIIGILCAVLGLFVIIVSLYAKYGYADYAALSKTLPVGGIWMIFGFGLTLLLCSIILILSACCYNNGCFKAILFVFAIVLTILLIMEVVSASILLWGLDILAMPKNQIGETTADELLKFRNMTVYSTWEQCCIDNTPPYNFGNVTSKVDSVCLWPKDSDAVKASCGSENVLVCVCKDATTYGADFGIFLQSRLMWVGGVTIVLALLLLIGLIATCVLICARKKRAESLYNPDDPNQQQQQS